MADNRPTPALFARRWWRPRPWRRRRGAYVVSDCRTQRGAGSSRGTKSTQILESTMGQRRKYELAGVAVRMRVALLVSGSTAQHTM